MDDIKIPRISLKEDLEKPVSEPETSDQSGAVTIPPITPRLERPVAVKRKLKINLKVVFLVVIALVVVAALMVLPFISVYNKGKILYASSQKLVAAVKSQDLPQIKNDIPQVQSDLAAFKGSLKLVSWAKFIPFWGFYVGDAGHFADAAAYGLDAANIAISTAEPYMDLLGFGGGEKATDGAKTAQERIDFFVKAIPDLIPKIGEISAKVNLATAELDQVNADRYPVKFAGRQVRKPLKDGLEMAGTVASLVGKVKPLLEAMPYYIGLDSPRTYMVIFQNDKELRPTGGFITAYAIMKVDKAKFSQVASNDIYNLDATYKPTQQAPDPLVKYLKGPYTLSSKLLLRDMNWSPDFSESMGLFTKEVARTGVGNIDGIIAVDTELLVNLLDAIGSIGVPGFGNFSTKTEPKCNCPQVIYELESFADVEGPIVWDPAGTGKIIYRPPNSDNRKKIIGPLMNSIMANVLGQPKDKLPALFEAGFNSLLQKHVLVYVFDEKAQKAAEAFGIAGKIDDYSGDYLHINDANLGGRKSNLYVTQEVAQDVQIARDGSVEKTVTITYKNPQKQDGWLNSVLPDWIRIYVPKGSQLIDLTGLDDKADPYEDLGKTVFAGYFTLRPEGVAKVTVKYKLPFKVSKEYKLLIQKQPGTDGPLYSVNVGRNQEEFTLTSDKEVKFGI
jgi:hypothetical protein